MSETVTNTKRRMPKIAWVILITIFAVFTAIVILTVFLVYSTSLKELPVSSARQILQAGRLADLPESATDVKAAGWHSIFTGEDYLMFRATSSDIEKFIANSPSLLYVRPEMFDSKHMLLPYSKEANAETILNHKFFFPTKDCPEWYDITIKGKGRRYRFRGGPQGHNQGTVIVDDKTKTIYINVVWS